MSNVAPLRVPKVFSIVLLFSVASQREVAAQPMSQALEHSTIEVANYTIEAHLDSSHRVVEGTALVHWTNTSRVPVTELWWHLYMNAFAHSRTLFMRSGGVYGHRGHVPGAHGAIEVRHLRLASGEDLLAHATHDPDVPDDTSQLRTPLPRPLRPGEAIDLVVSFRTELPAAFARTGYWRDFVFAGQWFPKLAVLERDGRWAHFPYHAQSEFYADFARYDVTLTVPSGDVVGATGVEVSPVVRTSRGDLHRFVATRVHDFAWTAWAHFREHTRQIDNITVRVLYPPGLERVAERNLFALRRGIPSFTRRFGSYPYERLTVVIPPPGAAGVAGMEYPTLITSDGLWFVPSGVHDAEYVALHEFAHQYFYGLLASDEWSWPFLDEGLAEYSTGLVMTEIYGPGRELLDTPWLQLGYWAYQGGFSGAIERALPIARPAREFPGFESYGQHVYRRAATIFRTAERTYGAESVARALRTYVNRGRFRHPTPDDLLMAFRDEMGAPFVNQFLRPALFDDATVDYTVLSILPPSPSERRAGLQGTAVVRRAGTIEIPVEIELQDERGHKSIVQWDGRTHEIRIPYRGDVPLMAVRIDPAERVPLDRNRMDNARVAPGHERSPLPLTARLAPWVALFLRAVGP